MEYTLKYIIDWNQSGIDLFPQNTTFHKDFVRLHGSRSSWHYCPNANALLDFLRYLVLLLKYYYKI
ncbi:MAG: hypothetical protein OHM56_08875 [Spiroplasma phoeniceum]|nr:MAG: hypothetical protein OHM57_08270 [Spiroplasma phoeniceum]UZQ31712.1 MAG: hypothetical protein OHM56_08875 [Spiroplasma phoeniceum]